MGKEISTFGNSETEKDKLDGHKRPIFKKMLILRKY